MSIQPTNSPLSNFILPTSEISLKVTFCKVSASFASLNPYAYDGRDPCFAPYFPPFLATDNVSYFL